MEVVFFLLNQLYLDLMGQSGTIMWTFCFGFDVFQCFHIIAQIFLLF